MLQIVITEYFPGVIIFVLFQYTYIGLIIV
jgi:hypothetical protein